MKSPEALEQQASRLARALPPKLLSVTQTCDLLGIGRTNFYGLVASGKLSIIKLGRRTLVHADVLDAFIAGLSGTIPSPSSEGGR